MLKRNKIIGIYENSMKTNYVNLKTMQAYSYGHYCYLKKIGNKLVLNAASYSRTTDRHINECLDLVKPDVIVYFKTFSLDDDIKAIRSLGEEISKLKILINKKETRKTVNEERKMEILKLKKLRDLYEKINL